ncbi:MAG: hypothetical protein PHW19_12130 [Salinivirgaceae bacterium]|nr:hypothetical protein [Salinivirgaceae bacterium]
METNLPEKLEKNYPSQITNFETGLIVFLEKYNLPTDNIFVKVDERLVVFSNIDHVINQLDKELSSKSVYLSKYLAASAAGLFDAALNYLWDETILQLRKRVSQYDIEFFYDNAVGGEKRTNFRDENDLIKLQDSELINGAKEIELISELGYKHLSYINYMRNWASAAHPNQNQITGLQIVSWLETCIKEVISLPLSTAAVKIKHLLSNLRKEPINASNADEIGIFLTELSQEQANSLSSAFFGIYTRSETPEFLRNNIKLLLPLLWDAVDESTKESFGLKYAYFTANSLSESKRYAREFLELVGGQKFIPDDLRIVEIQSALTNLLNAHRGMNNFYNEPTFVKALIRVIGDPPKIPRKVNKDYTLAIVEVFLSNGNGVAWDAEDYYRKLINQFDNNQSTIALLSFHFKEIYTKLQFDLCNKKFKEMLIYLRPKITNQAVLDLMNEIEKFPATYDNLKIDSNIKRAVKNLNILLK